MAQRTYSAGVCDVCGYGKIWEQKVLNPKTGKQMPAHVDGNGALLGGTGNCGKYLKPPMFNKSATNGTIFEQPRPEILNRVDEANNRLDKNMAELKAEREAVTLSTDRSTARYEPLLGEASLQQIFDEIQRRIKANHQ